MRRGGEQKLLPMAGSMRSARTLVILATVAWIAESDDCVAAAGSVWDHGEVFSEDLLLRPLSDGKVLSHFHFRNTARNLGTAAHHHVFPKSISQLVQKFNIREMELSFTQGRWNYERWGALDPIASSNAKPLGVELWATFDVPLNEVDPTWRNLTHALSGLFCASINFLESPAMMAAPEFSFRPEFPANEKDDDTHVRRAEATGITGQVKGGFGRLRYGALPREAVCTENLTPWLKLLPCRDKAGISTLLDRPTIYRGHYHSLRVHLLRSRQVGTGTDEEGTVLEQTLTLVLHPSQPRERSAGKALPHWSLTSLFGKRLEGSCPLAKTSHVLVDLEGSLVDRVRALDLSRGKIGRQSKIGAAIVKEEDTADMNKPLKGEVSVADNSAFTLSPPPAEIYPEVTKGRGDEHPSLLLDYGLQGYSEGQPLNLGMLWKDHVSWQSRGGPFRVTRFLVGSGNQKGSIMLQLRSNYGANLPQQKGLIPDASSEASRERGNRDGVAVTIFQTIPWYVRLYTHTLRASVDGREVPLKEIVTRMRISPAEDRQSPAVLEIRLQLSINISILSLNAEFDKGFLHIDEHPPDANRGFDLPSALISFPTFWTRRRYEFSQGGSSGEESPLLQTLQEAGPVHIYSENLLVPLATPDFSMPYNVITFTCTILALYFGSLLNTLRRRIGEEERRQAKAAETPQPGKLSQWISRFMEGKSETQKKLTKLLGAAIVLAIAIGANYFLDMV